MGLGKQGEGGGHGRGGGGYWEGGMGGGGHGRGGGGYWEGGRGGVGGGVGVRFIVMLIAMRKFLLNCRSPFVAVYE